MSRTLLALFALAALLGARPLAAYVIGADAVFKRFADKQASDPPAEGAVVGRASIAGADPSAQPVRIEVKTPGDCELILGAGDEALRALHKGGALSTDEALPAPAAAFAALGCPFAVFKGVPAAQAQRRIRRLVESLGVQAGTVSLSHLNRRPAWVVGARPGELDTPQVWFDKQTNRVIRVMGRYDGRLWDLQFTQPASLATAHRMPRVIEIYSGEERRLAMRLMSAEGGAAQGEGGDPFEDEGEE